MRGKLRLEKRPDKTFIGRIERGFDFLGYHFGPEGLFVAKKTIERYVERAIRLYGQEPGAAFASTRLGLYVQHWIRWARSGLEHFAHEKQGAAQQGPSGCGPDPATHPDDLSLLREMISRTTSAFAPPA